MADKLAPGTSGIPAHTPANPELDLKKRARRRLVGASALALLAVIVLPMVMDQEPQPENQEIQIRIPSQEPGAHNISSRIASESAPAMPPAPPLASAEPAAANVANDANDAPPAASAAPATSEPAVTAPATAAATVETKPAAKTEKPAKSESADSKTTQATERARAMALLNEEQWIIQLGAYQNQNTVRSLQAKLKELGYASYTEQIDTPKGPSTRVRCGPFASKDAAEKAHARLKKISAGGPTGGTIAQLK
ncbi:MAG: SPOR domain-containing protein [Sterolibacterium sp.]|nr:SPOR domain-containing protein [Sterolibacterium sp.]